MSNQVEYKINIDRVKKTFKFKEDSLTHSQGNEIKLLPYAANETNLVANFDGVIGAFSRIISKKELQSEFNITKFIEDIVYKVEEFEDTNSTEVFKDIIKTMFIEKNNLVNFDIKTINYIASSNPEEKIAKFLCSIFFDDELKELIIEKYDKEVENILYKIVLESLPELRNKEYLIEEYKCYLPFVKELFLKDFRFLIKNEELYKCNLKRFLEYYYMFYVSQLARKLSKFQNVDLMSAEQVYYTLNWESTSKSRTAYKFGWDLLKNDVNSLFSHAITLEFLNHHDLGNQLGYTELFEIFESGNEEELFNEVQKLYEEYTSHITYKDWNEFKQKNRECSNKAFNMVYKLFDAIEYQFDKSSRTRASQAYNNWYIKFVQQNFGKRRGSLGYNLNLTEEDIILMTKICINDQKKLKLGVLFEEFEKRGMFFDRDSKTKLVQLYEKLNLLEKKSDSGDAQYVRSVL